MRNAFEGSRLLTSLTFITIFCSLATAIIWRTPNIPPAAYGFMMLWLALSSLFCIYSFKEFVVGFLLSVFCMLIGWRISALYNITTLMYPLLIAFAFLVTNFIYAAYLNLSYPNRYLHPLSLAEWQLVFVRLYIGFDFVPHFTEKLFAGAAPHLVDVNAFMSLGVPYPDLFVWFAGFCELGAAIALGLGFIMRLGALGTVLYLFIATYLGHHFSLGFIWAGAGGGWEFATMWMVLILSFAVTGSHAFSIDQRIEDKYKLPGFIRKLL